MTDPTFSTCAELEAWQRQQIEQFTADAAKMDNPVNAMLAVAERNHQPPRWAARRDVT